MNSEFTAALRIIAAVLANGVLILRRERSAASTPTNPRRAVAS
jgi:hypothetical protein